MPIAITDNESPRASSRKKVFTWVIVILVVEAAVIFGVFQYVGLTPAFSSASIITADEEAANESQVVEVAVFNGALSNEQTGRNMISDVSIWAHVREPHREAVMTELEQFRREIHAEVASIWRAAEPRQLLEPDFRTVTRKVYAMLHERLGVDPETNEPIIEKVMIVSSGGIRLSP